MAIKFVDKEPGEGEPEAKPGEGEPEAKPAKREAVLPIEGEDSTERSGAPPLSHARPTPKKRGKK